MATINPDFSIGNAYEYKPLQIPNMDKVFDGERWAIDRADRLKKEAALEAQKKAAAMQEAVKDRNAEIAKNQTLMAQRLKFNSTGLTKEAEALVAKRAAELATLGGALGNVNDMTRPEVVQWNQDVDNLTNRIYEHQGYYTNMNKAATDYDAAVLSGEDVQEYNKQANFEDYLGRIQSEGLDFASPYMTNPIVKNPKEMTEAELAAIDKAKVRYAENVDVSDKYQNAGNHKAKRVKTTTYVGDTEAIKNHVADLNNRANLTEPIERNGITYQPLTKDERKEYNKRLRVAVANNAVNENGIDADKYAQMVEKNYRPIQKVEDDLEEIDRPPKDNSLDLNFNNNSGLLVGGTKNNPMIITYSGKNDTPFTKEYTTTVGKQTSKMKGDYVIRSVGELAQTGSFDPNSVPINQMKRVGKNGIEPVMKQENLTHAENKILKYIPVDAQGNYIIDNKNPNRPINVDDARIVKYRGVYTTPSEDRTSYIIIDGQAANPNDKDLRYEISREEGKATYLASKGQQVQQPQTPQNKTAPKTPPAMEMDFKGF